MVRYAKIIRVMKILRVLKLGGLTQIIEEKLLAGHGMTVAFQLLKMSVWMMVISHSVACVWFALAVHNPDPLTWVYTNGLEGAGVGHQWIAAFYFSITTGTTVGYGDIHPENDVEQIMNSLIMVIMVGYVGPFVGRASQVVGSLRHSENMMSQAKREALVFMTQRGVQREVAFKVLRYIEHTHETQSLTSLDPRVLGSLSKSLQNELALSITGNIFRKFPLFESADDAFLTALAKVGHTQRAGIGDIVVYEDQAAHEMYWVVRGEVAVMRRKEHMFTLRADDWFGELALFFPGAVRSATIRAEQNSEFLLLHHNDFHSQMKEFPAVKKMYDKLARELRKGNAEGLKFKCGFCGSAEHLTRNCPLEAAHDGDDQRSLAKRRSSLPMTTTTVPDQEAQGRMGRRKSF